ncbi:MAG TPA: hypothetical protein PK760_06060 [Flavobacteriales bacterium]|nr:hypothetical protein [Flavobacteriales bacterium]
MKRPLTIILLSLGGVILLLLVKVVVNWAIAERRCPWHYSDYYTKKGGWDYIRMPLIQPYDLESLDGGDRWDAGYWNGASREPIYADEVVVFDTLFVTYAAVDPTPPYSHPEHWALCIPKRKVVIKAATWNDMRNIIVERTTVTDTTYWNNISWLDCDSLWARFREKGGSLPWIPSCD